MWKLVRTDGRLSAFVARLALAFVMFPHGAQKALGWFGGHGFSATMDNFTSKMGIPWVFAFLAVIAEFLGPIGLVFGFLTRIAAFGILCVMIVAVVMVHRQNGFFMNWMGNQPGEGFEYHLLAMGLALALMIEGGGWGSADRALTVGRSHETGRV